MTTLLEGHIEIDPATRFGKPRIAGTRITVADVVIMHLRLGQSIEEIAGAYDLSLADLHAAMAYYYDHRDVIEESISREDAVAEAFRHNNPSKLQARLRDLKRG